jgi:phosphoglycerate dehydrogenase-like enzyme
LEIVPVSPGLSLQGRIAICKDAAFVIGVDDTPLDLLEGCSALKLVQLHGCGYDRIELSGVLEMGIKVATNGCSGAIPVAEQAIGLILAIFHRLRYQWESVRACDWAGGFIGQGDHDLADRTVSIIGLGHVGKEVT